MAEELGKIHKPEVGSLKEGRKLFSVPALYSGKDAPADYLEKFNLYWQQVKDQLTHLESRMGAVRRIYHETISIAGEDGLKVLEKLNQKSAEIAREKCQGSATLEITEDKDLVAEYVDWERCLIMGFISDKAAQHISGLYAETARKRYDHISKQIADTLKTNEVGVLFIREGHHIQFPADIEVFSVAPPALDDIHRWLRTHTAQEEEKDSTGSQPS